MKRDNQRIKKSVSLTKNINFIFIRGGGTFKVASRCLHGGLPVDLEVKNIYYNDENNDEEYQECSTPPRPLEKVSSAADCFYHHNELFPAANHERETHLS